MANRDEGGGDTGIAVRTHPDSVLVRGFFGTRERCERVIFAPQARFFCDVYNLFMDFDGFCPH